MTQQEKLELIAGLLSEPASGLSMEAELMDFVHWDSLTMTNAQIEFSMCGSNVTLEELRDCRTIGDLCAKLS